MPQWMPEDRTRFDDLCRRAEQQSWEAARRAAPAAPSPPPAPQAPEGRPAACRTPGGYSPAAGRCAAAGARPRTPSRP